MFDFLYKAEDYNKKIRAKIKFYQEFDVVLTVHHL